MTGLKVRFQLGSKIWYFAQPEMGNQDELSFSRINRRTRGGDLIIFRDAEWPKTEVQIITFDFNSEPELRSIQNMMKETLGFEMYYTDHENKTWFGIIQNPDAEAVQAGRNHYKITLKFEGDLA